MRKISRVALIAVILFTATILGIVGLARFNSVTASEPPRVIVAARTADLYSAPSFDSRIVRSVAAGTTLDVAGHTSDGGWWQVVGDAGSLSYVRSSLVEPNSAAVALPVVGDPATPTATPTQTSTPTRTPTSTFTATPTATPAPLNSKNAALTVISGSWITSLTEGRGWRQRYVAAGGSYQIAGRSADGGWYRISPDGRKFGWIAASRVRTNIEASIAPVLLDSGLAAPTVMPTATPTVAPSSPTPAATATQTMTPVAPSVTPPTAPTSTPTSSVITIIVITPAASPQATPIPAPAIAPPPLDPRNAAITVKVGTWITSLSARRGFRVKYVWPGSNYLVVARTADSKWYRISINPRRLGWISATRAHADPEVSVAPIQP